MTGSRPTPSAAGTWQIGWSQGTGAALALVSPGVRRRSRHGVRARRRADQAFGSLPGVDRFGRGITVSFLPSSVFGLGAVVLPAVVNRPFLEATGSAGWRPARRSPSRASRGHRDHRRPRGLPDHGPAAAGRGRRRGDPGLLRFQANRGAGFPAEWWLDVDDAALPGSSPIAAAGRSRGATVLSRAETFEQLSADPLALAIIGALSLGFVVAGLFAVIGLAVSAAVSARQRRTEFALLRALGLSPDQLSGWLWLENGSLVVRLAGRRDGARAAHRLGRPAVRHRHPAGGGARSRRSSSRCRGPAIARARGRQRGGARVATLFVLDRA